jgi:tetratricopeptide (TPR) repeat protein
LRNDRSGGGRADRGPRKDDKTGGSDERSGVRKATDSRQRTDRPVDPPLPDDVTAEQLDPEAWAGLRSLPKDLALVVARHLVMTGRLLDEDPERAYLYAKTARRLGSRVAVVREGCGIAAYHAGHWGEALAELRAARRLSGREAYLPVMADCERGLDRPERALSLARSAEAERLNQAERVEMRIVESGARRDMGQYDAAVLALQTPELQELRLRPWSARLLYSYADALSAAGRDDEAAEWFAKAAAADRDGETDAAERYAELEGLEIVDTAEDFFGELEDGAFDQHVVKAPSDDPDQPAAAEAPAKDRADAGSVADVGESGT